jgi:hypothetical protein
MTKKQSLKAQEEQLLALKQKLGIASTASTST